MAADFRQYLNLRPLDLSPAQIYLESIQVARTVLPNFELRPGTVEDAMFQAFAFMSALNIGAINRLPDNLMLGLGKMMGTPYSDGSRATMNAKFTANSNDGATLPAGTIVAWNSPTVEDDASYSYVFETTSELVIAANNPGDALPHGTTSVTSQLIGLIPPIPTGNELKVISFSQSILSAESAGTFAQGSNAETIDEFLDRSVSNIASMSSCLTTAQQLQNYIFSKYPNIIRRVKVYDLTDKDGDLELSDPAVAGKVVAFVYGPERNLTDTERNEILTDVSEKSVAGLEIGVKNVFLLNFGIQASVRYFANYNTGAVESEIKQNLLTAFSPNYAQFSEEILRNSDVQRVVYGSQSVHSVTTLSIAKQYSVTVTNAVKSGDNVVYTCNNHPLSVGDLVTVTSVTPNTLNTAIETAITARTTNTFTVVNAAASGTYASGGTGAATSPNWGSVSGSDINYRYKGSLLNLQLEKIQLTLTSIEI